MTTEQAWLLLDAVRTGKPVTNGDVMDAVATLGLCPVPPVQQLESGLLTTLVSQLSALVIALAGQTEAIHRMLDLDEGMTMDQPGSLNPRA